MDIQKEREAFENHLKKMGKTDNETFSKNEDDSYQMDIIHFGWKIWQAAKVQAVPEGFVLVKKTNRIGNPNVDFSQAPRWAKYWLKDGHSKKFWWSSVRPKKDMDLSCFMWGGQHYVEEAPSFGFSGDWDKSLTSKTAMTAAAQEPSK